MKVCPDCGCAHNPRRGRECAECGCRHARRGFVTMTEAEWAFDPKNR